MNRIDTHYTAGFDRSLIPNICAAYQPVFYIINDERKVLSISLVKTQNRFMISISIIPVSCSLFPKGVF